MHEEREASVKAERSTSTALILAKHQVVDDPFRETKVRLVSMSAVGAQLDGKAYREGWVAGGKVNLSRPVRGRGGTFSDEQEPGFSAQPCLCLGEPGRGAKRSKRYLLSAGPEHGEGHLVRNGSQAPSKG